MTTNLTEGEREVWKDLYMLHEEMHDMTGTDSEWYTLAHRIGEISEKYRDREQRLANELLVALYGFLSNEQKIREEEQRWAPQQILMEEIPWN